jgi:hypothetical protein
LTNDPVEHVSALLDLYRTRELDAAARARVAEHLAACEACARELAALESFSGVVARGLAASTSRPEAAPDPAARRRAVLNRIAEVERRRAGGRFGALPRWAPQAAAAAVAAIALGVVLRQGLRPPGPGRDAALERPVAVGGAADEAGEDRPEGDREELEAGATPEPESGDGAGADAGGAVRPRLRGLRAPGAGAPAGAADARVEEARGDAAAPPPEEPLQDGRADAGAGGERTAAPAPAPEQVGAPGPAANADGAGAPPADGEPAEADFAGPGPQAKDAAGERAEEAALGQAAPPALRRAETAAEGPADGERLLAEFVRRARAALAARDPVAAGAALELWDDSLAGRADVPPRGREDGEALADSLEDLAASRGDRPDRPAVPVDGSRE